MYFLKITLIPSSEPKRPFDPQSREFESLTKSVSDRGFSTQFFLTSFSGRDLSDRFLCEFRIRYCSPGILITASLAHYEFHGEHGRGRRFNERAFVRVFASHNEITITILVRNARTSVARECPRPRRVPSSGNACLGGGNRSRKFINTRTYSWLGLFLRTLGIKRCAARVPGITTNSRRAPSRRYIVIIIIIIVMIVLIIIVVTIVIVSIIFPECKLFAVGPELFGNTVPQGFGRRRRTHAPIWYFTRVLNRTPAMKTQNIDCAKCIE